MYQRIGAAAYRDNLDNTIALCDLLGNPERRFRSIHIAGTNGKGSTAHILASVLQEAGYKTGLYTSPHLKDFRERIRINGKMIAKESVVKFVERYRVNMERIEPSFFEWTVGLCFNHFAKEQVDIAILETGMGGRLDSTNVVTPLVSVITNIGYDHEQFLGNTLEKIAIEKAGIIKDGVPLVVGETQEDISHIFKEKTEDVQFADQHINLNGLETDLQSNYQRKNITTALQTIEVLREQGLDVTDLNIADGVRKVRENTGLVGRWDVISHNPLIICDIGHNKEGVIEVLEMIDVTPHNKLHMIWGMVNDKDADPILNLLPVEAIYYFCKPDLLRGLESDVLAKASRAFGLKGHAFSSVDQALRKAQQAANTDDLILVGGSTFVVAEVV